MINNTPIRSTMPELPAQTIDDLCDLNGLSLLAASQLGDWPHLLEYFLECTTFLPISHKEVFVFTLVHENSIQTELSPLEMKLKPRVVVEVSNMKQASEISCMAMPVCGG